MGSSLAKLAVAFLFIPAFYRHNVTTIYEFLLHRFGQASQVTASIFFFITRLAGSGVRLTVTAVAVAHLLGWSLLPTVAIFVVVSVVYIATGGVKAIVWTNVFQALMFLGAGALTLGYLVTQIDGGLGAIVQVAGAAGRLNVVNWGPAPGASDFWRRTLSDPNIVWVALLNGFIGSMAAFGTDHDLMQAPPNGRDPAGESAHAGADPDRHAADPCDLPGARRRSLHLLRTAPSSGARPDRRDPAAFRP